MVMGAMGWAAHDMLSTAKHGGGQPRGKGGGGQGGELSLNPPS